MPKLSAIYTIILTLGGLYVALALLLFLFQERLIFLPSRPVPFTPEVAGLSYSEHFFPTENGLMLHGWWVYHEGDDALSRPAILFCHGNAGNIANRIPLLEIFHGLGYNIFIFDYQGYGKSEGRPGERQILADGIAAFDFMTGELGVARDRILPLGRSMGGPVAAWVAINRNTTALALESTFTSIPDIARKTYPIFPVGLLARVKLPTRDFVKQFEGPVLVAHSPGDMLIPYEMGRIIYETAPGQSYWLELAGNHNDGHIATGPAFGQGYQAFIDRYFP
ncbi:MAG: alpha/beta hydrolase [Balneolales bacterium]|nr:alpha/beta hydrolase [Balneolales bacterium]